MKAAAGILSLLLGLGFGLPGVYGALHFARTNEVWTFMGFPTYGDGPFAPMLSYVLLPIELVFWIGFALPFGPILGLPRTILLLLA